MRLQLSNPTKTTTSVPEMSSTSAKRTSDTQNTSEQPNKRLKTSDLEHDKSIYGLDVVVFKRHCGRIMGHAPLVNVKTFAPEIFSQLEYEFFQQGQLGIHTHMFPESVLSIPSEIKRWLHWLSHRDASAACGGQDTGPKTIKFALCFADRLGDIEYRDAVVDFSMTWVREGAASSENLSLDRLRRFRWLDGQDLLESLATRLILHHDTEGVLEGDFYKAKFVSAITKEVFAFWQHHDKERMPQDPLSLSDEHFCKAYHLHHKHNLPCYKTKKLPVNPGV